MNLRRFGLGALVVLTLVSALAAAGRFEASAAGSNPVAAENALPGTPGWLGPRASAGAIEVYASATDAVPGATVDVHVGTAQPARYRVIVYRLG